MAKTQTQTQGQGQRRPLEGIRVIEVRCVVIAFSASHSTGQLACSSHKPLSLAGSVLTTDDGDASSQAWHQARS